jgi:hypothetical protein
MRGRGEENYYTLYGVPVQTQAVNLPTHGNTKCSIISSTVLGCSVGGLERPIISINKVYFFYQSGTCMQDIILNQLGVKTSAHIMQLHSQAKIHTNRSDWSDWWHLLSDSKENLGSTSP